MNKAKIATWLLCLLGPLVPSYFVLASIQVRLGWALMIFLVEYFAFQYVIALFLKKWAENHKKIIEENIKKDETEKKDGC